MKPAPDQLLEIFRQCWSKDTSSKYTPENPARGQCGVTALVANDLLGGEILKTPVPTSEGGGPCPVGRAGPYHGATGSAN
ncbi:MAG: hypothetical protein DIU69_02970 [Bacillota bacterium]|nr:MAG: hypothetical protein DIU69_02970 [Bacillota bacterium]